MASARTNLVKNQLAPSRLRQETDGRNPEGEGLRPSYVGRRPIKRPSPTMRQ